MHLIICRSCTAANAGVLIVYQEILQISGIHASLLAPTTVTNQGTKQRLANDFFTT